VAVPPIALSFAAACGGFVRVWHGETWTGDLFPWISAGAFQTAVAVQVDQLSAVMLLVVTGVSLLIHLYSVGYMRDDAGYARFFTYLNLFVFSMVMLVLAGNFLLLYVFWEGVGLCSYLLIGFWYERPAAADAGKKAFIVNRVGDFGFGLAIMLIWVTFGSVDYGEVFGKADATIGQLGYMFAGVGVGAYAAGIFHLVTHAFFKALLFLGAGSVIHGLQGEQDLRKMGGLAPRMLITTLTFFTGALGLSGVPP